MVAKLHLQFPPELSIRLEDSPVTFKKMVFRSKEGLRLEVRSPIRGSATIASACYVTCSLRCFRGLTGVRCRVGPGGRKDPNGPGN